MNDALALVAHIEICETVFARIVIQRFDLEARYRISNALCPVRGGYIVVSDRKICRNSPGFATCQLQAFEGLRAGHFVHQMPVNVKNGRAVLGGMHHVGLPEFVVESLGHGGIARRARLIEENSPRLCHS